MKNQDKTSPAQTISDKTKDKYSRAIKEAIDMQLASIRYASSKTEELKTPSTSQKLSDTLNS